MQDDPSEQPTQAAPPALQGLDRYLLDDPASRWARAFRRALTPAVELPAFGGPGWQAAGWQVQVAAAVVAAEAWRRDVLFLPQRIADEAGAVRYLADLAEQAAFADVARAVRAGANAPTYDELVARRAEVTRPEAMSR